MRQRCHLVGMFSYAVQRVLGMSQNGCLRISRPLAVAHHGRAARCRSGGDRVLVAGSTQEAIVAAACGPALRTPCCPSTASSRLSWQLHSVLSRWLLRTNGRATRCRCGGDRVLVAVSTQEAIVAAACGPALRTPCCPSAASVRLSWQLHSVQAPVLGNCGSRELEPKCQIPMFSSLYIPAPDRPPKSLSQSA